MIIELTEQHAPKLLEPERVDRLHAVCHGDPRDMHYDDFVQEGSRLGTRVGRHRPAPRQHGRTGRRSRLPGPIRRDGRVRNQEGLAERAAHARARPSRALIPTARHSRRTSSQRHRNPQVVHAAPIGRHASRSEMDHCRGPRARTSGHARRLQDIPEYGPDVVLARVAPRDRGGHRDLRLAGRVRGAVHRRSLRSAEHHLARDRMRRRWPGNARPRADHAGRVRSRLRPVGRPSAISGDVHLRGVPVRRRTVAVVGPQPLHLASSAAGDRRADAHDREHWSAIVSMRPTSLDGVARLRVGRERVRRRSRSSPSLLAFVMRTHWRRWHLGHDVFQFAIVLSATASIAAIVAFEHRPVPARLRGGTTTDI